MSYNSSTSGLVSVSTIPVRTTRYYSPQMVRPSHPNSSESTPVTTTYTGRWGGILFSGSVSVSRLSFKILLTHFLLPLATFHVIVSAGSIVSLYDP